jgi:site-specific recombinase XerD
MESEEARSASARPLRPPGLEPEGDVVRHPLRLRSRPRAPGEGWTVEVRGHPALHERRGQVRDGSGWCPAVERREARERASADQQREHRRMTFRQYAEDYLSWSATVHRAQRTAQSEVRRLVSLLGEARLDAITPRDFERCVRGLHEGLTPASVNRLRDRLSGMFKRAIRLGLLERNPVSGIPKAKEASGRLAVLSGPGESAVLTALPAERHALVVLAINTGLRWSEQARLIWRDVDLLGGVITVCLGKNGQGRRLPVNRPALSALVDAAGRRLRPADPDEPVFRAAYRTVSREFVRAVQAAGVRSVLRVRKGRRHASIGVTWHSLRHTFASRLVVAGVDLRTVQELGGWRTLSMVQRYAHLAPDHLQRLSRRLLRRSRRQGESTC